MNIVMLPIPPSVNHYWRKGKNGMHLSDNARAYKTEVLTRIASHRLIKKTKLKYTNGERLKVEVLFCFGSKHKRDLDNYLKGLLDALTYASVWEDDSQIDELIVKRGEVIKGGKCTVTVIPIGV